MLPSFSAWSGSHSIREDGRSRESAASNPRSRTPLRTAREHRDASSVARSPAPALTTGHVKADAWVFERDVEHEILANLVSVPKAKRLQFVLSCSEECGQSGGLDQCLRQKRKSLQKSGVHLCVALHVGNYLVSAFRRCERCCRRVRVLANLRRSRPRLLINASHVIKSDEVWRPRNDRIL